jgi:hypothetical protein
MSPSTFDVPGQPIIAAGPNPNPSPRAAAPWWHVKASAELGPEAGSRSSGDGWTELSTNGNAAAATGRPRTATGSGGWDFATLGKAYPHGTRLVIANPANGKSGTFPMTDCGDGSSFAPAIGLTTPCRAALGLDTSDTWSGEVYIQLADGSDMAVASGFGTQVGAPAGGGSAGGGSASSSPTGTTTTVQAYNFQVNRGESYWDAAQRLAQEVNWELCLDGNRAYYDSDTQMIKGPIVARIDRDDQAVVDWSFDWDTRSIATQMTLTLFCDVFEFMPGEVLKLERFGVASTGTAARPRRPGCWLIQDFTRNFGDLTSTFTLVQPTKPLDEPAPQVKTTSNTGTGAAANATSSAGGGDGTFPAPMASQYRNPPSSGPSGLGSFQGLQVALWIIPQLQYAQAHGWTGSITSGYRGGADPGTATGGAGEHSGTQYPHGAVDFGGPDAPGGPAYTNRANFFKACAGYTGLPLIPEQFAPYAQYPVGDGGHASGTGH